VELGKCGIEKHTRTHQDLEWFGTPERNTLRSLFYYCFSKILEYKVCNLRKLWCVWIAQEGLEIP
jgi:hypothetical protein